MVKEQEVKHDFSSCIQIGLGSAGQWRSRPSRRHRKFASVERETARRPVSRGSPPAEVCPPPQCTGTGSTPRLRLDRQPRRKQITNRQSLANCHHHSTQHPPIHPEPSPLNSPANAFPFPISHPHPPPVPALLIISSDPSIFSSSPESFSYPLIRRRRTSSPESRPCRYHGQRGLNRSYQPRPTNHPHGILGLFI